MRSAFLTLLALADMLFSLLEEVKFAAQLRN